MERFGTAIVVHGAVGQPPAERWRAAMSDREVKGAVLAWPSVPDGLLYTSSFVESMIKGISKGIGGAYVQMSAKERPLHVDYKDNAPTLPSPIPGCHVIYVAPKLHYLYKIILNHDAGVFALDLASAEFGHFHPVSPWNKYVTRGVREVLEYHNPNELPPATNEKEAAILVKRLPVATAFYDALKVALAQEGVTLE